MGEATENPELAEVQAILSRVQQLNKAPAGEEPAQSQGGKVQAAPPDPSRITVFHRKETALQKVELRSQSRRAAVYLIIAVAAILCSAAIIAVQIFDVTGAAVLSQESEAALLADAHRLLSQGAIAQARRRLSRGQPERRASVAFALAQSYDPNYLRSLSNADGGPDPEEAARWYKKWYELAVQSGLKMDAGQLQRLINMMQKH